MGVFRKCALEAGRRKAHSLQLAHSMCGDSQEILSPFSILGPLQVFIRILLVVSRQ